MTDGQTDGQTSCQGIVRVMHKRRAVKKTIIDRDLLLIKIWKFVDTLAGGERAGDALGQPGSTGELI